MTTTELAPTQKEGGASRLEAAKYLGVSLSTIKRMLNDKELKFERVRGRVVIPWTALYARIAPVAPPAKEPAP